MIHPVNALRVAASELGVPFPAEQPRLSYLGGESLKFSADSERLSQDEIPIEARYYPTPEGVRLAWKIIMRLPDSADWFEVAVDTTTGKLIHCINYTEYFHWGGQTPEPGPSRASHRQPVEPIGSSPNITAGGDTASYNVFPLPYESPYDGPQTIVHNPWEIAGTDPATAPSPYGWHDTNGAPGPETTNTTGNNVSAQEDRDNNNTGGLQPSGGPGLDFNYLADLTIEPVNQPTQSAAIVNLFYWNNVNHDIHYKYGFTEQAFNFQQNNYGRGGLGNDRVQADAQDGGGTNNANFATPADGSSGRMQMYLWTAPTPDRDGDFDSGIIAHEYGHGVSNRLITNGTGQMANTQSRGMGEGWSDFYALMFQQTASDTINGRHPIGTYALNQDPNTGAGIRTHPYSWNTTINPITWGYYGSGTYQSPYNPGVNVTRSTAVHWAGTIWCATLWDMNWNLITKHGYDSNLYTGYNPTGTPAERAGNKLALKLVMEAMKLLIPTNPSFVESRNAILQADQAITGGANQNEIWNAFARRGLGENAVSGSSTSTANIVLDFNAPWADPVVNSHSPSGTYLDTVSSVRFTFNQAMNPASFSVADDITSFSGPGGVNLLGSITGHTWINPSTLQVNFSSQVPSGTYSMTIGPNITAADDGNAMDQNRNGILGEPTGDAYTATFTIARQLGPETFGYRAAQYPLQNLDLVIGQPGVVTLTSTLGANAFTINLPAGNTFNFYGTSYTSVMPNTEGLITFGSTTTSSTNGDLTTSPTQAAIAPFWDNLTAAVNISGATDSALLYRIDGNWLIIEWSDMVSGVTPQVGTVTFQAILELNTGSTPGRIIFNYPDLDSGDGIDRGIGATTGIKQSGTQTTAGNRLLINLNSNEMPWVQSGKAIVVGLDVTPPTVTSATQLIETGQISRFVFSENVVNFDPARVLVVNLNAMISPIVTPLAVNYNPATFTGEVVLDAVHLDDGNYLVSLAGNNDGAGIRDVAGNPLDGDNSAVAGGNYVFSFPFFRGDANGDLTINLGDFSVVAANFNSGTTYSQGDFDYSGLTNLADFAILASKFNTSLPDPPPTGFARPAQPALTRAPARSPFNSTVPIWQTIDPTET
ncbi:MAG: M36 family metallopeptidase, partial [Phycisphaerae bacterium]|nr:M36 family metallopeptidase [Phycisphaerae bacterium]MDW8263191.1 M36 family metallopeptidase [Phycisphaerales bacterium]